MTTTTDDDDIVEVLGRCDPHDTDEVIKCLNAAAREIVRMRADIAFLENLTGGMAKLIR